MSWKIFFNENLKELILSPQKRYTISKSATYPVYLHSNKKEITVIQIMEVKQRYPITTVGAMIFNQENKFLLIKTHKWNHMYGIPGGKIDLGETCEQALIREIKEETGLDISDIKFVSFYDSVYSEEFYKRSHMILLNYTCKTDGNNVQLNEEAQSYEWVAMTEALKMNLNAPTLKLVKHVYEQHA